MLYLFLEGVKYFIFQVTKVTVERQHAASTPKSRRGNNHVIS